MKCCGFFCLGERPAAGEVSTSDGVKLGRTSSMDSRPGTKLVPGAIYEFHKPDLGQRMQVEIVFMHGLQVNVDEWEHAYYKTWRTADNLKEVWPETWLKEKYPNARILSLAYDSSARQNETAGNMDPYLLGESLLHQMVSTAGNIGQNNCPVVFVGHSLGGLIAKEIVVRCNSDPANVKYQNLLHNLKAVFFYATPHGGSSLADSWITRTADLLRVKTSSLVEYLKPEGTNRTRIHDDFLRVVNEDCKFYVVAEGRETEFMKGCRKSSYWIVRENSARFPGHDFVMLKDADHRTVCKPQSKNDTGYLKLIECIDNVIKKYSSRITVHLSVDPIGIAGKIDHISKRLKRPEVSIVGLFGMGGAGKTTLSKAFYNLKASEYAESCYLENVKSKGCQDVQKELLQGLCGKQLARDERVDEHHLDMIKNCLLEQKVLVVIDDVDSEKCLQDLQVFHALETESQSSQSKVVVTGRDRAILPTKYVNLGKAVIEDVNGIEKGLDLELFLRHAFDAVPQTDKEKVKAELLGEAKQIVELCQGLPLSLEVLGKYLGNSKDKDKNLQQWKEIWTDAYERLQKAQDIDGNKLWSSLRISYDHLGDLEKKMFLDFACIFSEYNDIKKKSVERIWGSPTGVRNLVSKSLLKVQDGRFVMHDQLRDMGRHILLKEALKDYKHSIYLVEGVESSSKSFVEFKKLTTNSSVQYITSIGQKVNKNSHEYSKLRLFRARKCDTPSLVDDCLSKCSGDLKWLHLENCSSVTGIGIQEVCSFGSLCVLHIVNCDNIEELPKNIDKLNNLAEMKVQGCSNLQSLPNTIGKLKNLKKMVIEGCKRLQVLPDSIGELCEVEHLSFKGCDQLKVIRGTQICTHKLMKLKLPVVPTTCLLLCPELCYLEVCNGQDAKEFPQDFFKTEMPKLKAIKCWGGPSNTQVVLKNPNGSELLLDFEGSRTWYDLEVHREEDGSISKLSHKFHNYRRSNFHDSNDLNSWRTSAKVIQHTRMFRYIKDIEKAHAHEANRGRATSHMRARKRRLAQPSPHG